MYFLVARRTGSLPHSRRSVRGGLLRISSLVILSAALLACSKTPPGGPANVPSAGSAATISSASGRTVSDQTSAPAQTGRGADTAKPVAVFDSKRQSTGARSDAQAASLEKSSLMAALFPGWKSLKSASGSAPTTGVESPKPDSPGHFTSIGCPTLKGPLPKTRWISTLIRSLGAL
jgi:hypothetical protein